MRRLIPALALAIITACGGDGEGPTNPLWERGERFVADRAHRRAALEASLVSENGYAKLRLDNYARTNAGGHPIGWDASPAYNPKVCLEPGCEDPAPIFEASDWTPGGILELGRRAFESYPLAIDPSLDHARRTDPGVAGMWVDGRGRVGGMIEVLLPDGRRRFAPTCATCHATPDADGTLIHGRANAAHAHGRAQRARIGDPLEWDTWGPGRVDVTPDGEDNPVAIPDLRPIRFHPRLHWTANVINGPDALAVRVDTLMTTSHGGALRPPREVAFAISAYLWSLGEALDVELDAEHPGHAIFQAQCAGCHGADAFGGPGVAPEVVGMGREVADSSMRGIGVYRAPALRGVSGRTQLLHDAKLQGPGALDRLLDPERLEAHPAHPFGTRLGPEDRQALRAFLETL